MAIDTREKRMSVVGAGRPWMRSHHTETIDEQWRLGIGNIYNGNTLASAVPLSSYYMEPVRLIKSRTR